MLCVFGTYYQLYLACGLIDLLPIQGVDFIILTWLSNLCSCSRSVTTKSNLYSINKSSFSNSYITPHLIWRILYCLKTIFLVLVMKSAHHSSNFSLGWEKFCFLSLYPQTGKGEKCYLFLGCCYLKRNLCQNSDGCVNNDLLFAVMLLVKCYPSQVPWCCVTLFWALFPTSFTSVTANRTGQSSEWHSNGYCKKVPYVFLFMKQMCSSQTF